MSMSTTEATPGVPLHHIHCRPGDVGRYVLLPGDPGRVPLIAAALDNGVSALRRGEPVVTDVRMVVAGITGRQTLCLVSDPRAQALSKQLGITRSAAGFRVA